MKIQKLLSYTRRAVTDYNMISPGDRIAIGISGGKDSLTLLYAMAKLKKFYPIPFELEAITVDLGLKALTHQDSENIANLLMYDIVYVKLR